MRSSSFLTEDASNLTVYAIENLPLQPAPGPGFLRAANLRTLWPYLGRYPKLPVDDLLEEAGIRTPQRLDPNGWLSVSRCASFIEATSVAANDPALGAMFAGQVPWRDVGLPAYIALNSPTLGTAIANACRYFALGSTGASAHLEVEGDDAQVTYGIHDLTVTRHPQNTLWIFALFVRMGREGGGNASWSPREVQFKHSRPSNTAGLQSFFRCPLVFDQPCDAMILGPEDLRIRFAQSDSTLLPILMQSADAALSANVGEQAVDYQVRRVVAASLRSGEVSIERIAMRLGTSVRTIQRRLKERGKSFKELVAETRLSVSRRYLEQSTMSLTDAALLLGYSDLSAFSRAFRRWTGISALEFRKRAAANKNAAS
jgi:AraC-like DNA-binding protein